MQSAKSTDSMYRKSLIWVKANGTLTGARERLGIVRARARGGLSCQSSRVDRVTRYELSGGLDGCYARGPEPVWACCLYVAGAAARPAAGASWAAAWALAATRLLRRTTSST